MFYDFDLGLDKKQAQQEDLEWISESDGNMLKNEFLKVENLENILKHQNDAIHVYRINTDKPTHTLYKQDSSNPVGYSLVFALNDKAVEDIKADRITTAFDIIPEIHLEESIDKSKTIYIALTHGFGFVAKAEIGVDLFAKTVTNDNLLVAKQGVSAGRVTMERMGFKEFCSAPSIKYCSASSQAYKDEISRKIEFLTMLRKANQQ